MNPIKISIYHTSTGKKPFIAWHESLDKKTRAVVSTRLDRIELGNFGDCKLIKDSDGIWELRIDYGPGYRIYFGKAHFTTVILLVGGDKSSQKNDILKAKRYWQDYKEAEL